MTISELYDLYRRVYEAYDHRQQATALVGPAALSPVARTIVEFAESEAQNGSALRSPAEFARALALGADALGPLGLRAA